MHRPTIEPIRILRGPDHRRMPWKNGRGETVEIAVFPPGATVDTFNWRISTAAVAEDGPFSVFPGIDRTLSILEGKGLRLAIGGRDAILLTRTSAPYAFPADVPTSAGLVDGTVTDLNVMTRRGCFSHKVSRVRAPEMVLRKQALALILCISQSLDLTHNDKTETLDPLDCALIAPGKRMLLSGPGDGFLIQIFGSI